MKNYEKAQFLIEQLNADGFKFGNAFFNRLEVALDKLAAKDADLAEALRLLEPFAEVWFALERDESCSVIPMGDRYKAVAEFVKAHK